MSLGERILDLLFPPRCPFCGRLLRDGEKDMCRACERSIAYVPESVQVRSFKHVAACVSPLYYEGSVRESLLRYKFGGVTAYCRIYGKLIAKSVDESGFSCDIITWVPLSGRRYRRRGYDQAQLIAQRAAERLSLPCRKLLEKTRDNPPQSSTGNAVKRRANAAGAYRCIDSAAVRGRRILIIDDIVTTGSTLSECAKVLESAGAEAVFAAAAACSRDG